MDQSAIWAHYQNENPEIFLGGRTRFNGLLKIARAKVGTGSLLNIGAGSGYLELQAQRSGWNVISVDPDDRTCNRLRESGIDARIGVIERHPIDTASVNVTVATEIFEHLSEKSLHSALAEIRRILVPGGMLIGTVPHRDDMNANMVVCPDCKKIFHRYGHQQAFTANSMKAELSTYFQVESCKPVLFPPWNIL